MRVTSPCTACPELCATPSHFVPSLAVAPVQALCFLDFAPKRLYCERFAVLCAAKSLLSISRWEGVLGDTVPHHLRAPCFLDLTQKAILREWFAAFCTATLLESRVARGAGYPQRCDPPHTSFREGMLKLEVFCLHSASGTSHREVHSWQPSKPHRAWRPAFLPPHSATSR